MLLGETRPGGRRPAGASAQHHAGAAGDASCWGARLNEFTGIQAKVVGSIGYSDRRLLELPVIGDADPGNEAEIQQVVEYLQHGGFVLGELSPDVEHGLQKYGRLHPTVDFRSEVLLPDHPVFRAYFDLTTPPAGVTGISTKGS